MSEAAVFAWTYLGLLVVILARGQATYWLSRVAVERVVLGRLDRGGLLGRTASWLEGPAGRRGTAMLRRVGVVAVPLAHLTVGVQTVVMAAAGASRMRWGVFSAAQFVGALAWAAIYSTIGFAAWVVVVEHAVASPVAVLSVVAVVVAVATVQWVARRRLSR